MTHAHPRHNDQQTRYLSQAIQLEEAVNPRIIHATMTLVSMVILAFIIWAGFTNINEVARTPGEVVPHGYQQTVQHLEGGIVKKIIAGEGDIVRKDDVLVVLDDTGIREDLARAIDKQMTLDLQAERLGAFIDGRQPDFSRFGNAGKRDDFSQKDFFNSMKSARQKEEQVVRDQIALKKQAIQSFRGDIKTTQSNYAITKDMYDRRMELNKKGYASDMQILETRQRLNDLEGDISRLENQIVVANAEIREFENRLSSLTAGHKDDAYEKLSQVMAERSQNTEVIKKLEDRVARLSIRAPEGGYVKGLLVNTVGAVVQPGQTLMEIVPLDKKLEVLVKISPKDIGHLKTGQTVQVKFSTFDFSRYGSIEGTLEQISATTFTGESSERYYQGRVFLKSDHVGDAPANMILPGMTVMADIITGEKTILQYLLKPIHTSLKTAFSER